MFFLLARLWTTWFVIWTTVYSLQLQLAIWWIFWNFHFLAPMCWVLVHKYCENFFFYLCTFYNSSFSCIPLFLHFSMLVCTQNGRSIPKMLEKVGRYRYTERKGKEVKEKLPKENRVDMLKILNKEEQLPDSSHKCLESLVSRLKWVPCLKSRF